MRLGARSSRWEIEFFFSGRNCAFLIRMFLSGTANQQWCARHGLIRFLLGSFPREKVREPWGQRQQLFQSSASTAMDCSPAVLLLLFHFLLAVK